MTIKTKLTLNVIIVLVIVAAVAATSFIGMGFVRSKLVYLTQTSTPFQMRTVELQRAIQGATADLVKVGASRTLEEFQANRNAAVQSLAEVKAAEESVATLAEGARTNAYGELNRVASELIDATEARLKAEEAAMAANKSITQKLKLTSDRLSDLDARIKRLHRDRSSTFVGALKQTKDISGDLREIELLRTSLKDLQLGIYETQQARDKRGLMIAKSKVNTALTRATANPYVLRQSSSLLADLKTLQTNYGELVKQQTTLLGEPNNPSASAQVKALNSDISDKLSAILLAVEQEVVASGGRLDVESSKQEDAFSQANDATTILTTNSELVSLGLTVQGLATRLFTIDTGHDVDAIARDLSKAFVDIASARREMGAALDRVNARGELAILGEADNGLASIRGLLFAEGGVIARIRHQIAMRENAVKASDRLREIVLRQVEEGKATVTTAHGEQEQAIASVNRMVGFSTTLIGIIGLVAVAVGIAFGAWVYHSISKPLRELMWGADQIAQGNLGCRKEHHAKDEIGAVQQSMCAMIDNLAGIVGKLKRSTELLSSNSEQLSATADRVGEGSNEQTIQIEQSATAMTEMSQVTLDVARNASNTAEAAQRMKELAVSGQQTMHVTVNELQKFADTVKESAQKVESLGRKSEEINKVVTLIKEVADQTSLLALNAAIEAARAGESGRGFAVVAENVKDLAGRTAVATDEISRTVHAMQSEVGDSVRFMQEERASVGTVVTHVQSTLHSIDEIVTCVEQVADMVQRIAVATEEQSTTSDEVSRMVETIAGVTRQLNASVGEIKRIASELAGVAGELNASADWFKV
jgi:methyl-accepting chemotaxis protein